MAMGNKNDGGKRLLIHPKGLLRKIESMVLSLKNAMDEHRGLERDDGLFELLEQAASSLEKADERARMRSGPKT